MDTDWRMMADCFREAGSVAWSSFLPAETLGQLSPPDRWEIAVYKNQLEKDVLVLETEGLVIGFSVLRGSQDADASRGTGELDAFYTHPRFWGRGGGQALMAATLALAKEKKFERLTLWTEKRNLRPRRFYELVGWRSDGEERDRTVHGASISEVRYLLEF
jgi:GNAT superfamily N-acetyltransferase